MRTWEIGIVFSPVLTADGMHVVYFAPDEMWSVWGVHVDTGARFHLGELAGPVAKMTSTGGGVSAVVMSSPLRLMIIDLDKRTLRQIPLNNATVTRQP